LIRCPPSASIPRWPDILKINVTGREEPAPPRPGSKAFHQHREQSPWDEWNFRTELNAEDA
jgi:hypothetical protein